MPKTLITRILQKSIESCFEETKGKFALAFRNLNHPAQELFINAHDSFYAASTIKTHILLEAFRQIEEEKFKLSDLVQIKNEFRSIVDNRFFSVSLESEDSQENEQLYQFIGQSLPLSNLLYNMITSSSNLATNLLVELLGIENISQSIQELGAKNTQIVRGVADDKAFELGLNNYTTAEDLLVILEAITQHKATSSEHCEMMLEILSKQRFNDIIPALLPKSIKIAHKTGSIVGVRHDSGVIFLPDGRKYILVLLSKDLKNVKESVEMLAKVSLWIYQFMVKQTH